MIVIFDRNYASLEMFLWLNKHNIKFVIRLVDNFYKNELSQMETDDEYIYLKHTYPRLQNLKVNYPDETKELEKLKETKIRCTKIKLPNGKEEKYYRTLVLMNLINTK